MCLLRAHATPTCIHTQPLASIPNHLHTHPTTCEPPVFYVLARARAHLEVDALSVAATLNVENTVITPAVLVVTDQRPDGICGQGCLPGACSSIAAKGGRGRECTNGLQYMSGMREESVGSQRRSSWGVAMKSGACVSMGGCMMHGDNGQPCCASCALRRKRRGEDIG